MLAYGSYAVFLGCCIKVDQGGMGRLAAGFGLFCAAGAAVFWYIAGRV